MLLRVRNEYEVNKIKQRTTMMKVEIRPQFTTVSFNSVERKIKLIGET